MLMILQSYVHIENELCALNVLKYVIFKPQLLNNKLGKSNNVTFKKLHVVIGRAFLDHA